MEAVQQQFRNLCQRVFSSLRPDEHASISFCGEQSHFYRFSQAKVRQAGFVEQGVVAFTLRHCGRNASTLLELTWDAEHDAHLLLQALHTMRVELPGLPEDPYFQMPEHAEPFYQVEQGTAPARESIPDILLTPAKELDLCGFYASGPIMRGYANSFGVEHWFSSELFNFSWSLYLPDGRASKHLYAGRSFDADAYQQKLALGREQLALLSKPAKTLTPGSYRVYLAPQAAQDFVGMLGWSGLSVRECRDKTSSLRLLYENEKSLNSIVRIANNCSLGYAPRFNEQGFAKPAQVDLIGDGRLLTPLIGTRSALEYDLVSNGAESNEAPDFLDMAGGDLPEREVLRALGTGIYLNNLHYLNYSDQAHGRITGMSRFACLWVEKGKIIGPIEKMRFDETIYRVLGDNLIALTKECETFLCDDTYEMRRLGGSRVPGMLVEDFQFTL